MTTPFQLPFDGVQIGHATDADVITGTTAVVFDQPCPAAISIMGSSPGTRETELLDAQNIVQNIDALVLSGGSAFGLDAAGGTQAWLAEQGRGIFLDPVRIPIVPCAILFDMRNHGDKNWGQFSPYRNLGYHAASNAAGAGRTLQLGKVGAAFGAATANTPGGFGAATAQFAGGHVTALVAVNAVGSPMIGDTEHFWAAPFEENAEFGGLGMPVPWPADAAQPRLKSGQRVAGQNTTLGVVLTDFALQPADLKRLATHSHDGFARALYPVHTTADGDLIFSASVGDRVLPDTAQLELGIVAGNCMARAIATGVFAAQQQESKR